MIRSGNWSFGSFIWFLVGGVQQLGCSSFGGVQLKQTVFVVHWQTLPTPPTILILSPSPPSPKTAAAPSPRQTLLFFSALPSLAPSPVCCPHTPLIPPDPNNISISYLWGVDTGATFCCLRALPCCCCHNTGPGAGFPVPLIPLPWLPTIHHRHA